MHQPRRLRLTASIILCFVLQAQGADKYTDENRPYEFGFKIDGEQHRHESKDKDGIVMGEFGFITADNVYHVTVYATDKEGRFIILSMKNIHLKSSPDSRLGSPPPARQGHSLALPPPQAASVQASGFPQGAPKLGGVPTPSLGTPETFPPQAQGGSQGVFAPQPGKPSKPVSFEPPGKSCSSCSLPTTTTRAPPPVYKLVADNNSYNSPNQFGAPRYSPQNQQTFSPPSSGQQNTAQRGISVSPFSPQGGQQNYPSGQQNIPQQGLVAPDSAQYFAPQPDQTAQNYPGSPSYSRGPGTSNAPINYVQPGGGVFPSTSQTQGGVGQQPGLLQPNPGVQNRFFGSENSPYAGFGPSSSANSVPGADNFRQNNAQHAGLSGPNAQPAGQSFYPLGGAGERTPKQYNGPNQQFNSKLGPNGSQQGLGASLSGQRGSAKPTLVSAQMQIVDKNTDIYTLGPNEQRGLPPGLTQDDMTQLLYTFNYTVGFHGHFEEGYTNGVKKGYYYVTGRNGVRTRIDYVADDTGFHPKVSQEVLDLLSDDVPKPETEKDAKYGLKGYEFKWLYYPVESKRR